ncbi:hypothetical protein D4764_02G0004100 [Takifugu flavidus]|uniref:Uncharacterized protein n=1 Tax=Takifugu flavidus TaxID=433684 RepID=A0A5C6NL34_9TELE|nr:hypothetical protein D4764_02G0004100 [Takifugu flavidus]
MNRTGDKGQPWRSPTLTGNESDLQPAIRTKLLLLCWLGKERGEERRGEERRGEERRGRGRREERRGEERRGEEREKEREGERRGSGRGEERRGEERRGEERRGEAQSTETHTKIHYTTGITATTSTSGLAATACDSRLDNGGAKLGPFRLNVPYLPRNTIKALSEVGVEDQPDGFLHQAFPTDPH